MESGTSTPQSPTNTGKETPTPLSPITKDARTIGFPEQSSPIANSSAGNSPMVSSLSAKNLAGIAAGGAGISFASAKLNKQNWTQHNQALESKHERDIALADLITSFLKKKTEMEMDYCRGLERLLRQTNSSWNSAKFTNNNTRNMREGALAESLSHMLTAGEIAVKARTERCEAFLAGTLTPLWQEQRKDKIWISKKALETHTSITEEMFRNVVEYEKAVKSYVDAEKENQIAAKKLLEYEKNPKTGVLSGLLSKGGTVGANAAKMEKYKKRASSAAFKSNEARNEYLIQLSAFNAMNSKYSIDTIPHLLTMMDGKYYETLQKILADHHQQEVTSDKEFLEYNEKLLEIIAKVRVEDEEVLFWQDSENVIRKPNEMLFDPYGTDTISTIYTSDLDIKEALSGKLGSYHESKASLDALRAKQEKEIAGLEHMVKVYTNTPEFGNAANPKEQLGTIRLSLCQNKQQIGRLEAMIGVIASAGVLPAVKPNLAPRSPQNLNIDTNDLAANLSAALSSLPNSPPKLPEASTRPLTPTDANVSVNYVQAMFDYVKQESDELSFKVGTVIKLLTENPSDNPDWAHGQYEEPNGNVISGLFPIVYTKPYTGGILGGKLAKSSSTVVSEESLNPGLESTEPAKDQAIAMYDFTAEEETDLTLRQGDIITNLNMETGQDGWWYGTIGDKSGYFPRDYVMK